MERDDFSKNSLTKEQKTGFVLLLIFGILAVGLGFLQLRNTIYGPFVIKLSETAREEEEFVMNEEARLQSIDTDRDGLNDYEELNFYETSPYLPDTDSDGLNDKLEIEKGSNPLCPEGEDCNVGVYSATATSSLELMASPLTDVSVPEQEGLQSLADLQTMLSDPAQVRQLFLSTGKISAEDLNKISDEELMKMVDEIVAEQGGVPE